MRKLVSLFLGLVLLCGTATGVIAQDASPAASPAAAPAGGDPAVGDPVPYIAVDGTEVAILTIQEIIDPFEEYGEFSQPEPGTKYIAFQISFENIGSSPLEFSLFDFVVQDTQGFVFGDAFMSELAEGSELTLLEDSTVSGGETLEGVIVFQIFNSTELAHMFYQPESDRLITIADFRN